MDKKLQVSISSEPAKDINNLFEVVKKIEQTANFLHFDIMDGSFVPNKTYDEKVVKFIKNSTSLPLDVHLMVDFPKIDKYLQAGANILTIHYESKAYNRNNQNIEKDLKKISASYCLAGLSITLSTPVSSISTLLNSCDLVLVMSVNCGESGQKFSNIAKEKIIELDNIRKQNNLNFKIEVDGGITPKIAKEIKKLGVNIIVSGSYVYSANNMTTAIKELALS